MRNLKNVANGLKASEKVRKCRKSEKEHCKVLYNGIRHRKWSQSVAFLSSFVVLEYESSQIVAKVSDKCCTWFVMHIGNMGSHQWLQNIPISCVMVMMTSDYIIVVTVELVSKMVVETYIF